MKIATVILKDTSGNYINIHTSAILSDAKNIFKNLKAQARICKEKKVKEAIEIDGQKIEICGMWLFSGKGEDKYISMNGYLTADEEKQEAIFKNQQKTEQERIEKEAIQKAESLKAEQAKKEADKLKAKKDEAQKLKELEIEKQALLVKAEKLGKLKKPKVLK